MRYNIKCNFVTDTENGCHRYIQAGITDEDGIFTGIVIDRTESGECGEFLVFYGENLYEHEDFDDAAEMTEAVDKAYPGLLDAVNSVIDSYAVWEEEGRRYGYTDAFIKEFFPGTRKAGGVFGTGGLEPFRVAATEV